MQANQPITPYQSANLGLQRQQIAATQGNAQAQRDFTAQQAEAARAQSQQFTAGQNQLTRMSEREIADLRVKAQEGAMPPKMKEGIMAGLIPGSPEMNNYLLYGDPRMQGGKPNEFQQKVAGLLTVAVQAAPIIDAHESSGMGLSGIGNAAGSYISGGMAASEGYKQLQQAGSQFVQAYLYSVSGAQAPEQEVVHWKNIALPAPGDTDAVRMQKRAARASMTAAMQQNAKAGMPVAQVSPLNGQLMSLGQGSEVQSQAAPPNGGGWKVERIQ